MGSISRKVRRFKSKHGDSIAWRASQEDKDLATAEWMAITREQFHPPLNGRSPQIISCVGAQKKIILNFGLAKVGADPMLTSIEVFEEAM